MRIVVDTGDYTCGNLGDVAMLQVTVSRFAALCPQASIHVLTKDPERLRRYCPSAQPLSCAARNVWCAEKDLLTSLHRYGPRLFSPALVRTRNLLRDHSPTTLELLLRVRTRLTGCDTAELRTFCRVLRAADLVVLSGSGGITDHARSWATWVLGLLQTAIAAGKPTALFGHGLGPLTDSDLIARAQAVLPRVNLLALREKRAGLQLAKSLHVPTDKILVTGDDAIEPALAGRSQTLGNAVGVNLRVSSSAQMKTSIIQRLRPLLHSFARQRNAPLIGIPISFNERSTNQKGYADVSDASVIDEVLRGYPERLEASSSFNTTSQAIRAAGRCRLLVTGAYHAAVFALSQGVPAVCLVRSDYFADKFLGLADMFGAGCEVVSVGADDFEPQLTAAMSKLWDAAERTRPSLLEVARDLVRRSQAAYEAVADLAVSRARSKDILRRGSALTASCST